MDEVVAVVGSRDWPKDALFRVRGVVEAVRGRVVSGGSGRVDKCARRTAIRFGIPLREYRVLDRHDGWYTVEQWDYDFDGWHITPILQRRGTWTRPVAYRTFGQAAYHRNDLIAREATRMEAFLYNDSKGTTMDIELFQRHGKEPNVHLTHDREKPR